MIFLHLAVDAEPVRIGLVRHGVAAWLTDIAWPRRESESIVFAVSEVVSNSVEHAYRGFEVGRVVIELFCEPVDAARRRVRLVVTDFGLWRPDEGHPHRGNGLPLVEAMSESLTVDTDEKGTRVTVCSVPVSNRSAGA